MMPKCSPVRCTALTLEQLVPEDRKIQKKQSMKHITLKLMMPKCSPVRYTTLTLEQPVPVNRKVQRNTFEKGGSGVEPAKYPPKVKSENVFYNSRVLERN